MLQILSKNININLVSSILSRYKVKASISRNFITIDGIIPNELLESLCSTVSIISVQNYNDNLANFQVQKLSSPATLDNTYFIPTQDYKPLENPSTDISEKIHQSDKDNLTTEPYLVFLNTSSNNSALAPDISPSISKEYDLIYSKVSRGDVYLCDLGTPYGHEQGKLRPVIIVQNDVGNAHSPTTIVVPITSQSKKPLPTHVEFYFSEDTLVKYNPSYFKNKLNIALAEQIQVVDTRRLRKYLGRMKNSFMRKLDKTLFTSLDLSPTLIFSSDTVTPDSENTQAIKSASFTLEVTQSVKSVNPTLNDAKSNDLADFTIENAQTNDGITYTSENMQTNDRVDSTLENIQTNEQVTLAPEGIKENESVTTQEKNDKPKTPREEIMEKILANAEANSLQPLMIERIPMESALDISISKLSTEEKVKALLQSLGLNNPKKEFNYLVRGIMAYHSNPEIDFYGICAEACRTEFYADKSKVKNMINARIKKKFTNIKSPHLTFEFIKLINCFL